MEKAKVLKAYFSPMFSLVRSVSWPPRPPEPSARACGNAIGMMLWSRIHGDGWQESSFEKKKKKKRLQMLANKLGRIQQNVPGAKRPYQRDPSTSWGASAGRMGEETSTGPFLPELFYKSVNFGHSRAPFLPSLSGKGTNLFWQRPPSSSLLGPGVYI